MSMKKHLSTRVMAVFLALVMCLGMLPTAAFAVGEETAPCPVCQGLGQVEADCAGCDGTGRVVTGTVSCPACGGGQKTLPCAACVDGKVTRTVTEDADVDCEACGGSGQVTDPETGDPALCAACEGVGTVKGTASREVTEDCQVCGGSGETEAPACETCGGTGTVQETTDCQVCGGTGRVAKPEDPVDTEAIAAAIGEVGADLQDLGDRFGAFQEEFFWNLTGEEEDPAADFAAAAAVEFGKEFNALLAKYKAIPAEVTETEYAGTYAEMEYALQMMADAMGGDLNSGVETLANNEMSWTWTVTIIGLKFCRSDGTESSTNKYTKNGFKTNYADHELGYRFKWNSSAGGSTYNGGWQLIMTADGADVDNTTAYVYTKDMSRASATWTASASSHTGNSSHPFTLYASDYPKADYSYKTYTLNYNANGGTDGSITKSEAKNKTETSWTFEALTGNPTRTGYTLDGWSTTSGTNNAEGRVSKVTCSTDTKTKTVYAIWKPIDCTITYTDGQFNGAAFTDDAHTAKYDSTTPGYTGGTPGDYTDSTGKKWEFDGWNPGIKATVDGDQTYTAKWKEKTTPTPNLTVEKEVLNPKTTYQTGDHVTYRITVTNSGTAKAESVVITDELPSGKLFFENYRIGSGEAVTTKPADNRYSLGNIDAGQSASMTITARVLESIFTSNDPVTIRNTAAADYTDKPSDVNPSGSVEITVEPQEKIRPLYIYKRFSGAAKDDPTPTGIPQNFYFDYSYTDRDGEHTGTLKLENAEVTTEGQGDIKNAVTYVWKTPLQIKVLEGDEPVMVTLTEHNYLIGDNKTQFVWKGAFYTIDGSTSAATGQVGV